MHKGLVSFSILGVELNYGWSSTASPIYPSGLGIVTVSVENALTNGVEFKGQWAIDSVVRAQGNGSHGALVHYTRADFPSVWSSTRDVMTAAGYTCRVSIHGPAQCASVADEGRYTWAKTNVQVNGLNMDFVSLN